MIGRTFAWVGFILIATLTLFAISEREGGETSIDEINNNLTIMTESLQNMSQSIPYVNPYSTNFTFKDFVFNTGHILFYPIAMELNTVMGVTVNLAWEHLTLQFLKTLALLIALYYGTRFFLSLVKPSGVIYVIIDEYWNKKHNKSMNHWVSIPLSVISAIIFTAIMWGIGIGILFLISYF